MATLLLVIVTSALSGAAVGQNLPKFGSCPKNIQPMMNFDVNQFSGKWYVSWLTPTLYEWGDRCSTMTLGRQADGALKIDVQKYNKYGMAPDSLTVFGSFYEPMRPNIARLDVDFTLSNNVRNQIRRAVDSGYYVLGTDYRNFAVMYNCLDLQLFHVGRVLVFSRCKPKPQRQPFAFRQGNVMQFDQGNVVYPQPAQPDPNVSLAPNVKMWLRRLPSGEFSIDDLVQMQQDCGN